MERFVQLLFMPLPTNCFIDQLNQSVPDQRSCTTLKTHQHLITLSSERRHAPPNWSSSTDGGSPNRPKTNTNKKKWCREERKAANSNHGRPRPECTDSPRPVREEEEERRGPGRRKQCYIMPNMARSRQPRCCFMVHGILSVVLSCPCLSSLPGTYQNA